MCYIYRLNNKKIIVICYSFCIFAQKTKIMVKLRINDVLKAHGMKQKDLADKMGIKPISLNQMLGRGTFGVDRLGQMADIIGCKVSELLEVDSTPSGDDFASYIRYHGIHYTADTLDDFFKQVDELRAITRR